MEPSEIKERLGKIITRWTEEGEAIDAALEYIKTLEAEREKAELIAWGLARGASADNELTTLEFCIHPDGENEWYLNGATRTHPDGYKDLSVYNLPDGRYPSLTDEALAILRAARAKERGNG